MRFQICGLCRSVLTSPEILQPSHKITNKVTLCGGTLQETRCSLRAMLLHHLSNERDPPEDILHHQWPDYESMNGVLVSVREPGNVTVLKIFGWPSEGNRVRSPGLRFHLQAYLGTTHRFYPDEKCSANVLDGHEDDPAAEIITSRPFIQDLGSGEAFEQMRHWIKRCEQSHPHCDNDSTATAILPCRVIDVQSLKLHQPSKGDVGKYAALTYCWGCKAIPGALVGGNLQALKDDIAIESLPPTIKDSIFITQRLGLKYIWIDAYCIIQDSVKDKNKELARMAEIYSQAYVTLSASSAASVYDGFLYKRQPRAQVYWHTMSGRMYQYPRLVVPFRVPNREGVTGNAVLQAGYGDDGQDMERKDPIMHRSWTFQERLLSRRILIFGTHELYWQCNGAERSCGAFDNTSEYSRPAFLSSKSHIKYSIETEWKNIVKEYSGRDSTHEEDKLVALAGVASRFSEAQGDKDVYLAGLWRSQMRESLLWVTQSKKCSRPSVYVAPTWSWASARTPNGITWWGGRRSEDRDEDGHSYLEFIQCETTLKTRELPFGQVTGGKLRVRGPLRPGLQRQSALCSDDEQDARPTASPSNSSSASFQDTEHEMEMAKFIRHVIFDVDSEARELSLLFYLRVEDRHGLALIDEQPGVFRRVGVYRSKSKEMADNFFLGGSVMDIEVI